jgi:hypothetical protein
MEISLDEERWQVDDDRTVMDVLAEVSDRAHRHKRVVLSLVVGGRTLTDRDLLPALLNSRIKDVGSVLATSRSLHDIVVEAKTAIGRFASQLQTDGSSLIACLRNGRGSVSMIDSWLGRLADYTELLATGHAQGVRGCNCHGLTPWIQELLDARSRADAVRMADLLEYELLPRLLEHDAVA